MSAHMSPARKRFQRFLISLALVHVVGIGGYYLFAIGRATARTQRWYAWTWMGATVAVALVGLQRIKRARGRPTVIRRPD